MKLRLTLPILLVWAAPCMAAPAFGIAPFKVQIVPETPLRSSQVFQLQNGGKDPQAIQIHIEKWMVDDSGKETNTPDITSFSVYPEQFVLQPNTSQSVRVTWQGMIPEKEKAFRLVAEQLPVDFETNTGSNAIRFLLSYRAALYVTPQHATNDIQVESFSKITQPDGNRLDITLINKGNAHTLLHDPVLVLDQPDGKTLRLNDKAILDALADRNIHAGDTLKISLPWPKQIGSEVKGLKLEFTPAI